LDRIIGRFFAAWGRPARICLEGAVLAKPCSCVDKFRVQIPLAIIGVLCHRMTLSERPRRVKYSRSEFFSIAGDDKGYWKMTQEATGRRKIIQCTVRCGPGSSAPRDPCGSATTDEVGRQGDSYGRCGFSTVCTKHIEIKSRPVLHVRWCCRRRRSRCGLVAKADHGQILEAMVEMHGDATLACRLHCYLGTNWLPTRLSADSGLRRAAAGVWPLVHPYHANSWVSDHHISITRRYIQPMPKCYI
jgi:hypothetical protein